MVAGPFERGKDSPLVAESNLALGRVHVDVHLGRIDQHTQHRKREAIGLAESPIGLLDREHQVAMLNPAAVDQDDHVIPGATVQGRRADQSAHARFVNRQHRRGGLAPIHRRERGSQVTRSGCLEDAPSVDVEAEGNRRISQGEFPDQPADHGILGRRLLQELQAGGRVEEQLPDGDPCADRTAGGPGGQQFPGPDLHSGPFSPIAAPADRLDLGNGGNAGQGLAAKAKGVDRSQILEGTQLAGRMAAERHRQVGW